MTDHKQNLMFNKNLNSKSQYYNGLVVWIVIIKLEVQNWVEFSYKPTTEYKFKTWQRLTPKTLYIPPNTKKVTSRTY